MVATMSDLASSASVPAHHLKIWSDGKRIYAEIPGVEGKPSYITTYPFDSRGVALTLSLLGLHRVDYDYKGTVPDSYLKPSKEPGTHAQRAAAEAFLRRGGIIK
jgi:hypothetical protein